MWGKGRSGGVSVALTAQIVVVRTRETDTEDANPNHSGLSSFSRKDRALWPAKDVKWRPFSSAKGFSVREIIIKALFQAGKVFSVHEHPVPAPSPASLLRIEFTCLVSLTCIHQSEMRVPGSVLPSKKEQRFSRKGRFVALLILCGSKRTLDYMTLRNVPSALTYRAFRSNRAPWCLPDTSRHP